MRFKTLKISVSITTRMIGLLMLPGCGGDDGELSSAAESGTEPTDVGGDGTESSGGAAGSATPTTGGAQSGAMAGGTSTGGLPPTGGNSGTGGTNNTAPTLTVECAGTVGTTFTTPTTGVFSCEATVIDADGDFVGFTSTSSSGNSIEFGPEAGSITQGFAVYNIDPLRGTTHTATLEYSDYELDPTTGTYIPLRTPMLSETITIDIP